MSRSATGIHSPGHTLTRAHWPHRRSVERSAVARAHIVLSDQIDSRDF
jgi:hypothetical protein